MSEQRLDFKCVLRSRLNKIMELHGQALAKAVGQREPNSQEAQLPTKDLIQRFADTDPTPGKSRTQWLVKTYIQDERFKLEDSGRATAALSAFERFKRRLSLEQRELSRFKSLRELEALVDPFVKAEAKARLERDLSTATGREKRRLEEWKARDESIVVQEEEGLPTIVVPMTKFASCWWGRGTRWCTAAKKDNVFQEYHIYAPLVIIVCPDGEKFQMNVKPSLCQFMDNTDENVGKETLQKRWSEFQSLLHWAIHHNGDALEFVPKDYRTPELCLLAVRQNGQALAYVPSEYRTPELCRIAIEQDGLALEYVPIDLKLSRGADQKTPELCRLAVKQHGNALKYVPEKTPELCRMAVEQNGGALIYVPCDLTSNLGEAYRLELYYLAVKQNRNVLRYLPEKYRTTELCRMAIDQDGWALKHVPEDKRSPEFYLLAVQRDGTALEFVPEEHKTSELCHIAVQQKGDALRYIPKNKRTPELYRLAVEQKGCTLRFVPEDDRTPELCRIAVKQNWMALYEVPGKHKTPELCRLAVKQDGDALQYVPKKYRTPELMALIQPVQPEWHPDILQGLCSKSSY
jgi:Domain of unknown function (DUF4116)